MRLLLHAAVLLWMMAFASCARVPIQSVELMDNISREGERMHQLNVAFVNNIFDNKKAAVDEFMRTTYTPEYIAEIKRKIPAGVNMEKEWPNLMMELMPQINKRRDSLVSALEYNKDRVVARLNEAYRVYEKACDTQKNLLSSVVKVDNNRRAIFNEFNTLSKGRIDLNKLEPSIDKMLVKGGSVSEKILELNSTIDNLINNK